MPSCLTHESLNVYQCAIDFVPFAQQCLIEVPVALSVYDQLSRASESIPLRIACGNGQPSVDQRLSQFEYAYGSALESAACLDILAVRAFLNDGQNQMGKRMLHAIVKMLVGLRRYVQTEMREDEEPYVIQQDPLFDHESLEVYQLGLHAIKTVDSILLDYGGPARIARGLDRHATSVLLNIAEGNGRFSEADRCRFLDIAHMSALKASSTVDIMVAGGGVGQDHSLDLKQDLSRAVSMILGLKRERVTRN